MSEPATIEVTEQVLDDVPATGANLFVTVSASKLFTGKAALKQAVEVKRLIDDLREHGITEEEVSLCSVFVNVEKGIFSKSSTAIYRLNVHCGDLDLSPQRT